MVAVARLLVIATASRPSFLTTAIHVIAVETDVQVFVIVDLARLATASHPTIVETDVHVVVVVGLPFVAQG